MTALRVRKLTVRAMPGFRHGEGFTLDDLDHDVVVLLGPNGSGKSTTARAIGHLLWPDREGARQAFLDAEFRLGDEPKSATLEAGRIDWRSDGVRSQAPLTGDRERAAHYNLALPELLSSGGTRELTQALQRELVGGYDLRLAAGLENDWKRRPRGLENALLAAKKGYSEAVAREREVRNHAGELLRLERERLDLEARLDQAEAWERRRRHLAAARQLREAEEGLAAFAEVLAKVRPDDANQLEEAIDRRRAATAQWMRHGEASAEWSPSGRAELPMRAIGARELAQLEARIDRWARAEDELDRLRRDELTAVGRLEAILGSLLRELGVAPDDELRARLSDLPHRTWTDRFREALQSGAARDALRKIRERLLEGATSVDLDRNRRASSVLREWLAQPTIPTPESPFPRRIYNMFVAAAILVGLIVWALGFATLGASLMAAGAGMLVVASQVRPPAPLPDRRPELQAAYLREELPHPDWGDAESVRRQLTILEAELEQALTRQARQEAWKPMAIELQAVEARLAEAEARRSDLGLTGEDFASVARLLATLDDWSRAESELAGIARSRTKVEAAVAEEAKAITGILDAFDFGPVSDAATARRVVVALREWVEIAHRCRQAFDAIGEARAAEERLRSRHGVEDLDALRLLVTQLPDYQRAKDRRGAAAQALESTARDMAGFSDAPELTESELEGRLAELTPLRKRKDDLVARIAEIRAEINRAKGGFEVETTLAEREAAYGALADERNRQALESVAEVFATAIIEESEQRDLPLVFERAKSIFGEVTQGRYRLMYSEETFGALDQVSGRLVPIEALSSGTQIQLLLSIRLAFVQLGEAVALPLLLDETLATSDPERSAEVIRAVGDLIRDGRQAFYFTTQPDEARQWEQGLEGRVRVIRLDEIRRLDTRPELWQSEGLAPLPEPPRPPIGGDYEAYRQLLGVPPKLDPRLGIGGVHLWHLFQSSEALFVALKMNRPEWGRFEGVLDRVLPEVEARRVRLRAAALESAIGFFRVGRPSEPVTVETLRQAGMTDHFIEKVEEHARESMANANDFYRRLQDHHPRTRIPNTQERFRNALAEYLETHGFVDLRPPLDRLGVEDRVVQQFSAEISQGELTLDEVRRLVAAIPFPAGGAQQTLDF
jgi:DNA repair exonuclease SbcCD ATPase subunit